MASPKAFTSFEPLKDIKSATVLGTMKTIQKDRNRVTWDSVWHTGESSAHHSILLLLPDWDLISRSHGEELVSCV